MALWRWVFGLLSAALAIGAGRVLQVLWHVPFAAGFLAALVVLLGLRIAFALLTGELRR